MTRAPGTSEDDGGEYKVTYYRFARVEATVNERDGSFERIHTADSSVALGGGLQIGMSLNEVARILQVDPTAVGSNWEDSFCELSGDASPSDGIALHFDPAPGPTQPPSASPPVRRLRSVELTSYGP